MLKSRRPTSALVFRLVISSVVAASLSVLSGALDGCLFLPASIEKGSPKAALSGNSICLRLAYFGFSMSFTSRCCKT